MEDIISGILFFTFNKKKPILYYNFKLDNDISYDLLNSISKSLMYKLINETNSNYLIKFVENVLNPNYRYFKIIIDELVFKSYNDPELIITINELREKCIYYEKISNKLLRIYTVVFDI